MLHLEIFDKMDLDKYVEQHLLWQHFEWNKNVHANWDDHDMRNTDSDEYGQDNVGS